MARVSRSAGVEKASSRDLTLQKGPGRGQLGELRTKAGGRSLRELRGANGQAAPGSVGGRSGSSPGLSTAQLCGQSLPISEPQLPHLANGTTSRKSCGAG